MWKQGRLTEKLLLVANVWLRKRSGQMGYREGERSWEDFMDFVW
uniref:Uncharacterized protein n=1 Tax=Candidozyma auris TaxID=498019 RepID=A0A0L0NX93_CANAR